MSPNIKTSSYLFTAGEATEVSLHCGTHEFTWPNLISLLQASEPEYNSSDGETTAVEHDLDDSYVAKVSFRSSR